MRCKFHCPRAAIFSPALAIHRTELELLANERSPKGASQEFVIATPYNDGTDIIQMVHSNCRFHVQCDLRMKDACVKDAYYQSYKS
jgi:hypothetical protein